MKKVIRLVSVQLWAMLGSMFTLGYGKKKSRALYASFALIIIVLSGVSFLYSYLMGMGLRMYDSIQVMPTIFMAITSIMVLITTIYKVKGTVFGFKDYDLLMSLPVKSSQIVASRLILLYSINLVFVLIIMIPMMVAYGILANPGGKFYISSILTLFFIPLIPIVLASFLGTLITYMSMRFRYSNIIYIVFSFLFVLAMMIGSFFVQDSPEEMVEISQMVSDQINSKYPLAKIYSRAVTETDWLSMVIFVGASVLVFMVYSLGVGKVFKRINTSLMTGRYKANYKLRELKKSSPIKALYIKEVKRYLASPVYVLNTGFGIVILVLASIALPFMDLKSVAAEMEMTGTIEDMISLFVSFCIATSCTTMASISIEGKNLWISKSLPIPVKTIFTCKILFNFTIHIPSFFASILICLSLQIPFIKGFLIVLTALTFSVFVSLYGLLINLNFPNLTWTNETQVVKQSTASMISIFSTFALVGIQFLLQIVLGNFLIGSLLFICLVWICNLALYKILMTMGIRKFERL